MRMLWCCIMQDACRMSTHHCPPPSRSHTTRSKEVILQLVHHVNTAAALAALPTVTATADTVAEAIGAAQQRGSLKGVRALLHHAQEQALSRGPEAREMWRAAIVALGALRRPAEARAAFVGMRSMGAWEVGDTATVNLLLNALAADVKLQFIRCEDLAVGIVRWGARLGRASF